MRILAIDPGVTCGAARFYEDKKSTYLSSHDIMEFLGKLESSKHFDRIFVEGIPALSPNVIQVDIISRVLLACEKLSSEIYVVFPGEWKPIAKAQHWNVIVAQNQHEKDAFFIMKFCIMKTMKIDISEPPYWIKRRLK